MTAAIVPFVGLEERSARQNLDAFIEHAKSHRWFAPGPNAIDWASSSWDLRPFVARQGQNPPGLKLHFTTYETTRRGNRDRNARDFPEPFLDAAKALVVEYMRTTGVTSASPFVTVLRCVERAFRELGITPDVVEVTPAVLDRAADIIRADFKATWSHGRFLERLALEYINPAGLSTVHLIWKSPFPYQGARRNDRVNREGGAAEAADKLPHLKCILDLAGVFHTSDYTPDLVVTGWFALAMLAPSRVNEILALPVDCETEMDGSYGIAWRPSKGGDPMTKFATSEEWAEVANTAIEVLKFVGVKARRAAQWYEENPGGLYLPPGWEHVRGQPLTRWEIAQILGKSKEITQGSKLDLALEYSGEVTLDRTRWRSKDGSFSRLYTFASVERYVESVLPAHFPYVDGERRLKVSEALFCVPRHVLRGAMDTEQYVPNLVSYNQIKHELGSKPTGQTIFERHGLVDPESGEPWKLKTHQPRHLLNTLAQSKHLSQALIAFWSGRKQVAQNAWYDHIPQEAFIEAFVKMGEQAPQDIRVVGPLEKKVADRARKEAIDYADALRLELGSIINTRYGLCRHNYALTPCPKDKDCINCGENTFVKGDERHLAEARNQLRISRRAVANCQRALEDDEPGVERWLEKHVEKVTRWTMAVDSLSDASIPDGTLITLPPPGRPQSKTGLAAEIRAVETSSPNEESLLDDDLALKGGV